MKPDLPGYQDLFADESKAPEALDRIAASRLSDCPYQVLVKSGNPAEMIKLVAEQIGADLIVMATHGRHGLAHFMLGSVAEKVIREAPCLVMMVRPDLLGERKSQKLARALQNHVARRLIARTQSLTRAGPWHGSYPEQGNCHLRSMRCQYSRTAASAHHGARGIRRVQWSTFAILNNSSSVGDKSSLAKRRARSSSTCATVSDGAAAKARSKCRIAPAKSNDS